MDRVVKVSHPHGAGGLAVYAGEWLSQPHSFESVYETVESFKNAGVDYPEGEAEHRIPLKEVVNIHNVDGIESVERIMEMSERILAGEHLTEDSNVPNIKLVWTDAGKLLLFDGHHTMLAYMLSGRNYLHEVPHIIVENHGIVYVTPGEISVFYGEHAARSEGRWRRYVVNWMKPRGSQLDVRRERNMGELLAHFIDSLARR